MPNLIETAPRNGDALLLVWAGLGVEIGFWDDRIDAWTSAYRRFPTQPTHWTPLPGNQIVRQGWRKWTMDAITRKSDN